MSICTLWSSYDILCITKRHKQYEYFLLQHVSVTCSFAVADIKNTLEISDSLIVILVSFKLYPINCLYQRKSKTINKREIPSVTRSGNIIISTFKQIAIYCYAVYLYTAKTFRILDQM